MIITSCLEPSVLRTIPHLDKILLVNYAMGNQQQLNKVLEKYPQIRNFYNDPPHIATILHINQFIADSLNHTIVSTMGMKSACSNELVKSVPTLHYFVLAHQLTNVFNESFFTIQRYNQPFSFSYCDFPRKELDSWSPFVLFNGQVDTAVWLCLVASIILISVLVKRIAGDITSSAFLIALSALISGGVSISSRTLRHSWLLTLWMSVCLIFVTYYSGNLTSEVISPTPEFRFTKLAQLVTHNYNIVVNEFAFRVMKRELKTGGLLPQAKIIKSLISAAEVADYNVIHELLITKSNCATLFIWPNAFKYVTKATMFQAAHSSLKKHCYVGQELFFDESLYIVVSRPRIVKVGKVLRVLMEQGIFHMWIQEYVGVSGSHRVQYRSRVISSTKLREEHEKPIPLTMKEGKLKNVFALWLSCLIGSGIGFVSENNIY